MGRLVESSVRDSVRSRFRSIGFLAASGLMVGGAKRWLAAGQRLALYLQPKSPYVVSCRGV